MQCVFEYLTLHFSAVWSESWVIDPMGISFFFFLGKTGIRLKTAQRYVVWDLRSNASLPMCSGLSFLNSPEQMGHIVRRMFAFQPLCSSSLQRRSLSPSSLYIPGSSWSSSPSHLVTHHLPFCDPPIRFQS